MTESKHRTIRSFVLRKGRLTAAQQLALDELWPHFGIEHRETVLDFEDHFERPADVILEIGFGNGESTWRMALQEPEKNFVGIEVHEPGVGHLLMSLEKHAIENVRIVCGDAVPFVQNRVADASLAGVRIYFALSSRSLLTNWHAACAAALFCTSPPTGNPMPTTYWKSWLHAPTSSTSPPPATTANGPNGARLQSTRNAAKGSGTRSGIYCTNEPEQVRIISAVYRPARIFQRDEKRLAARRV
jgi:hypothetical protein